MTSEWRRRGVGLAALVPLLLLVLMAGGCTIERMVHDDSAADALGALDDELDFWDEVLR